MRILGIAAFAGVLLLASWTEAADAPIAYSVGLPDAAKHYLDIEVRIPNPGGAAFELMMPVWSPGYYHVEDYASRVEGFTARGSGDRPLEVLQPVKNRWRIAAAGDEEVRVTYRLLANSRSVVTNYVDDKYLVLNPGATFMTRPDSLTTSHEVSVTLPRGWTIATG